MIFPHERERAKRRGWWKRWIQKERRKSEGCKEKKVDMREGWVGRERTDGWMNVYIHYQHLSTPHQTPPPPRPVSLDILCSFWSILYLWAEGFKNCLYRNTWCFSLTASQRQPIQRQMNNTAMRQVTHAQVDSLVTGKRYTSAPARFSCSCQKIWAFVCWIISQCDWTQKAAFDPLILDAFRDGVMVLGILQPQKQEAGWHLGAVMKLGWNCWIIFAVFAAQMTMQGAMRVLSVTTCSSEHPYINTAGVIRVEAAPAQCRLEHDWLHSSSSSSQDDTFLQSILEHLTTAVALTEKVHAYGGQVAYKFTHTEPLHLRESFLSLLHSDQTFTPAVRNNHRRRVIEGMRRHRADGLSSFTFSHYHLMLSHFD